MRHLSTLIAAMFVAPLSWLLLAIGQDRSAQVLAGPRTGGVFDTGDLVRPVICLAGAGLLLGLLATLRFSPLGAVLTGAGYAAGYLALLVDPDGVLGLFPRQLSVAGHSVDPTTPLRTGTTLLLGILMVVAAVGAARWRRRPAAAEPAHRVIPEATARQRVAPEATVRQRIIPEAVARPARAQGGSWDVRPRDPGKPAPSSEPELVARYPSTPRSANNAPNSSKPGANSTDRWAGSKRSTWPYARRPQHRSLDG